MTYLNLQLDVKIQFREKEFNIWIENQFWIPHTFASSQVSGQEATPESDGLEGVGHSGEDTT